MQKNLPLFLLALLFHAPSLNAQTDYSKIDARARELPFPKGQNIDRLANDLSAGLKTEKEKARAIFAWITENIRYDIKTALDEDAEATEVIEKQTPANVLKSHKAVCAGYANLFNALCAAGGLTSLRVNGYTKTAAGRVARIGHAWNLLRVDGEWSLVDATWGAGGIDEDKRSFTPHFNEQFFLGKPEDFLLRHYPEDPLFQLRADPIDFPTFKLKPEERTAPAAGTRPPAMFPALKDSLDAYAALDSSARVMSSWSRMLRLDPNDGFANYYLALYHYNKAVEYFNAYTAEMNRLSINHIRPTTAIWETLNDHLAQVRNHLDQALERSDKIQQGHKYFRSAATIRREADSKQKLCANAQKRTDDMKTRIRD